MTNQGEASGVAALILALKRCKMIDAQDSYESSGERLFPIGWFALTKGLSELEIISRVAEKFGFEHQVISPNIKESIEKSLNLSELKQFTLNEWLRYRAIPWKKEDGVLWLLCANPFDVDMIRAIEFRSGMKVVPTLSIENSIIEHLRKKLLSDSTQSIKEILGDSLEFNPSASNPSNEEKESTLAPDDPSAPTVVRLVDKILTDSIERGASDIHFIPEKEKLTTKIRVDGTMRSLNEVPSGLTNSVISRVKLLSGMDIAEKRKPQDGRLRVQSLGKIFDLRSSTVPSVYGETLVARILRSDSSRVSLDTLGMPEHARLSYERLLRGASKVLLVSGPTGSGKTSTLYAGLTYLADGSRNIITIEDPIEYRIDGITQIQVHQKIGMGFAEGLRSVLRQDPDVVMVGEIRDLETAQTALNAAQTGHLVLSTIHTNSALAGIVRLLDMGVQDYIIASSISAIVAQRLLRRLCPHCALELNNSTAHKYSGITRPDAFLREAKGCKECGSSGYSGRVGIYSILEITSDIAIAIRQGKGEKEISDIARCNGYRTLWEEALDLISAGITTFEEAERVLGPLDMRDITSGVGVKQVQPGQIPKSKLLLVEDDETTRSVLKMLFEDQMFDVVEAENGVEALEKIYQDQPNIIVCDLMMPRMSGLDLVKKLRADRRISSIPVLMLTAASTEENELRLIDSGADDFVAKTTDSKIMIARLNRLLQTKG